MDRVCEPLASRAARLRQVKRKTVLIGLCGAQGSGKSTIAAATVRLLRDRGLSAVALSLDDFYLPKAARETLAAKVHPLLATRGPPGTHDVALAGASLDQLRSAGRIALPAFDKAADNRKPRAQWETVATPVDVVIFEGWCVGARAQGGSALAEPVNDLERDEDAQGRWRAYVNAQLDGPYQTLFERLHELVLLEAPSFEVVLAWRTEQERKLRERTGGGMSDAELARFIAHYERLTRWILTEMPGRANWTVRLDADRNPHPDD
ncbi:kinase [Phenylobacterium deserti]|uniref:Kinase n=1 Tax=Phenylobacterium deserti TaxID=1914756 RepID=A0A328ACU2_9CAUL|nr:kinase [Phenylobacterium deserti]